MVVGISLVKDEADIIAATLGQMLTQVDRVIVADNGSTDGTRDILADTPGVEVSDDPEVGYYQAQKMTALASRAADTGAEWVVAFDADEWWQCEGRIADLLESLPPEAMSVEATLFDHVATGVDGESENPAERLVWRRRDPAPLRKVACRCVPGLAIHQGNHAATFPGIVHPLAVTGELEIRHFPYRSVEQFVRKVRNGAAAYAASDLPGEVGAHWRGYGRVLDEHGERGLADVFHRWFYRSDPTEPVEIEGERQAPLIHDPAR